MLFDGGHTALARLSNAQAGQLDEALGGAARRRESAVTPKAEINLERWRRRSGSVGVLPCDNLAAHYLAFIKVALDRIWLRPNEPTP